VDTNPHLNRILKQLLKKLPTGMMTDSQAQLTSVNEDDLQIIIDFEEEQLRRGNFDLIFPIPQTI
jgi:hypothetical protein